MQIVSVRHPDRRRAAFTLLEVLVVVAILVVLGGVASIYGFRALEDSKKSTAQTGAKTLEQACQQYKLRAGSFPPSLQSLIQPEDGGLPFIQDAKGLNDPWGNAFQYDPNGAAHNGLVPDIYTTAPDGSRVGNN